LGANQAYGDPTAPTFANEGSGKPDPSNSFNHRRQRQRQSPELLFEFEFELELLLELEFELLFEFEFELLLLFEFELLLELELLFELLLEFEFDELLPANCSNFSLDSCSIPKRADGAVVCARRMLLMPPVSTLAGETDACAFPAPVTAASAKASAVPIL